ncbi:MAG: helix-turn-helix transcriptional regulator [Micromonosporaceae bacterium]
MARRRKVSNLLALAILSCLREQPMHPYEMAATIRTRGKEHSIKLNYGSLYTVVDNLAKHGLIEAIGAQREGRRPERTVYRLTDAGRAELEDWMAELIATPAQEYPQFKAALSEIGGVHPDEVLGLLRDRVSALESDIAREAGSLRALKSLPRLFVLEEEYHLTIKRAELEWVRGIVKELEDGSFPDLEMWRRIHDTGEFPPEFAEMAGGVGESAFGESARDTPGEEGGSAELTTGPN